MHSMTPDSTYDVSLPLFGFAKSTWLLMDNRWVSLRFQVSTKAGESQEELNIPSSKPGQLHNGNAEQSILLFCLFSIISPWPQGYVCSGILRQGRLPRGPPQW
jgi:hypothetical protein